MAGEALPRAGLRVVPSQTTAQRGKGSPWALRPELGSHGRSCACPQPKTGWEGSSLLSVLPPHGLLHSSQQPWQVNDDIPISRQEDRGPERFGVSVQGHSAGGRAGAQAWFLVLPPDWHPTLPWPQV